MPKPPRGLDAASNSNTTTTIETSEGYDLWAAQYDSFNNPMIGLVDLTLRQRPLKVAQARVLELGCGTARLASRILDEGAVSYSGVDGSEGMLSKARAGIKDTRVRLVQADISSILPFEPQSFDLIVISLVLEHLPFLLPVFREAARVLTDQGRMRILEIHSELVSSGTQAHFWHEGQELRFQSHSHSVDEFREALAAAGFSPEFIEERFATPEAIAEIPKLARHQGKPVFLDIQAIRQSR